MLRKNYALIVPTKALINEVRSKIIKDLEDNLEKCNYRVVSAASDIALNRIKYTEEQINEVLQDNQSKPNLSKRHKVVGTKSVFA